jgi:hypothetical protein
VGDTLNSTRPGSGAAGDGCVVEWELEQAALMTLKVIKRAIHFMRLAFRESEWWRLVVFERAKKRGQSNPMAPAACVPFRTPSRRRRLWNELNHLAISARR